MVVAIIGILASSSIMSYFIAFDRARVANCKLNLEAVKKGMEFYMSDFGEYPESSDLATIEDLRETFKPYVDFKGRTECDDELEDPATNNTYRLEAKVYYSGGAQGGMEIILENAQLYEQLF